MVNSPGVFTKVPNFGNTSAIEWLDPATTLAGVYFYPLIDSLTRLMHYERGKDLRAAPYDFRYDPGLFHLAFLHASKCCLQMFK